MKKKNTGVEESNQGHRAKMNSSDRSGLEGEEGWTTVLSKSSKKMLRKQQRREDNQSNRRSASKSGDRVRTRSRSASSAASHGQHDAADEVRADEVASQQGFGSVDEQEDVLACEEQESAQDTMAHEDAGVVGVKPSASAGKKGKRARPPPPQPERQVVQETPPPTPAPAKKGKVHMVKINAADGRTLDDHVRDIIKNSEEAKPRDVDPSSKAPAPSLVRQVAEMLIANGSSAPPLELGIPSTKRRGAALRRLKHILSCNYMQAEKLLTYSALTHDRGKESYAHALALGKYFKQEGAKAEDGAEAHREHLRKLLCTALGYTAQQVNLALVDLEASLGVLNVTASEVQGWLVRQAVAYNKACQCDDANPTGDRPAEKPNQSVNKFPAHLQKATSMLQMHGMKEAAEALQQAAAGESKSGSKAAPPASDAERLFNTVNNLQQDNGGRSDDPYWNRPPAVRHFLNVRDKIRLEMQNCCSMTPRQLLQAFDAHVARQPTFLEAVQTFPKACQVACELSRLLQTAMEAYECSIRELELGSRMFLADVLERCTDRVLHHLDGPCNRKLVEAEVQRAFRSSGDCNEAVQLVIRLMREQSIPTPSWRKAMRKHADTPRALGAAYRLGEQGAEPREPLGTSARRKAAGFVTVRMAAQQEKNVQPTTPMTSNRYQNADAVSTLRKEDPELSSLSAEQQLRIAARRVSRRIDFDEAQCEPQQSSASKRSAAETVSEDEDEDGVAAPAHIKKTTKARQSVSKTAANGGGDGDSSDSDGSSASSNGSSSGSEDSSETSENDSDETKSENSDDVGSACRSDDDDSRDSNEEYDTSDDFCVEDDAEDGGADKPKKAKKRASSHKKDKEPPSSASKRAASVNSLGTPKKDETASSANHGGNVYFGEDELKKWTVGSEKYKQGFNWPAYIHHKQNYDNYCQFKGMHAARTFKSVIHAKLVPAVCGFCGLQRLKWRDYEDATVILAIEKTLRPSKSTDFALELKQIKIADDKEFSLMQNYTCFFENFSYKVAEAEDANRSIKPNVVKSTFKSAISGHEILKLWLEEVPWRGLNKANARLLRKLREVRSWEQLQRKGITSATKRPRTDEGESDEARPQQERRKPFRGTRAGKSFSIKKRSVRFGGGRKGRNNYGAAGSSDNKRSQFKFQNKSQDSGRSCENKRKHSGLDQRGESWHDNKELFECFNTPCLSPFCQRCGRHGHTAAECRIPDDAPGINLKGYYQEEKKGKARIAGPPPRNNAGVAGDESDESEDRGKNNAQRGSGRRCLQRGRS